MFKITVVTILCLVSVATLYRPWIGALSYVVLSVMSPQSIWFWGFEGIRASYIIGFVTGLSFVVHLLLGKISLSCWKSKQNALVAFFWFTIVCSYYFGAIPPNNEKSLALNSQYLMENFNKTFIMFFLIQPLITSEKIISYLLWALVGVFAYYTYWANAQYFSGDMFLRGVRLSGPSSVVGTGNYIDENVFATLFVLAIPFFFFLAQDNKSIFIKIVLYLLIPFGWHSIFLTGSRGGLVGLSVVTLYIVLQTRKYIIGILIIAGLIAAFVYQGGEYIKGRSNTIIQFEEDASAMQRIEAWKIASRMITDHPILGVGLGNFILGSGNYSSSNAVVAHSTIIQFAAENGIFAALAFMLIFVIALLDLHEVRKEARKMCFSDGEKVGRIISIANALEGGCIGFFACGLFLSLGSYDIYFILVMIVVLLKWHLKNMQKRNDMNGLHISSLSI